MKIIMLRSRKKSIPVLNKILTQFIELKKYLRVRAWQNVLTKKALPWYLVLAPNDDLTKTWLAESAERFTWQRRVTEYNDVVPSINVHVSQRLVLLEPSVHFWGQPGIKNFKALTRWQSFCRLLRRQRWLQPLNGVIVLLDFKLLAEATLRSEYLQKLTQVLPDIAEVSLGQVPIYFFVAGLEDLQGFKVYAERLRPEQKEQIFGITLPQTKDADGHFADLYQQLLRRLDEKLLCQIPRDQSALMVSELIHFPSVFAAQQKNLAEFLKENIYASGLKNKLWVRGVYFTSQESFAAAPIKEVIVPEALLGSARCALRQWLIKYKKRLFFSIMTVLMVLMSVWLLGTLKVEAYLTQVNQGIAAYQRMAPNSSNGLKQLQDLASLRAEQDAYFFRYLGILFPSAIDKALQQLAAQHGQKNTGLNFQVQSFKNIAEAEATLADFNNPQGAWQTFTQQVLRNQHEQKFAEVKVYLANVQNQQALMAVTQAMKVQLQQVNSSDAAVVLSTQLLKRQVQAFNQLAVLAQNAPAPLQTWFMQLLTNTTLVVFATTQAALVNAWRVDIGGRCNQLVGSGFPLQANSTHEISLANFTRIFAPGGVLSNFANVHLNALLATLVHTRSAYGAQFILPSNLQNSVLTMALIQNAFFASGAEPSLNLQWTPLYLSKNLAQFNLNFGAQNLMYQNGPRFPQNIHWSTSITPINLKFVSLDGRSFTQNYQGAWALFRLLQNAVVKRIGVNNYQITFNNNGFAATYQVKLVQGDFAGVMALMRFSCGG